MMKYLEIWNIHTVFSSLYLANSREILEYCDTDNNNSKKKESHGKPAFVKGTSKSDIRHYTKEYKGILGCRQLFAFAARASS